MARATIKKNDAKRIRQYILLVNGIIDFEDGIWYVDTPDDYEIFHSTADLMEYINENLKYMREAYENNGELAEWEAIEQQAAESRFPFWGNSDRMNARR